MLKWWDGGTGLVKKKVIIDSITSRQEEPNRQASKQAFMGAEHE